MTLYRPGPSIAILTALTDERAAVERLLRLKGTIEDPDESGYQLASLPGVQGNHSISLSPEFRGQFLSAFCVSEVVSRFPSVGLFIFVGCAGGVPGKVSIGDVVVARNVVDLDTRKIGPGGDVEHRSSCPPPDARVLQAASSLFRNDEGARSKWKSYLGDLLKEALPSYPGWPAELLPPDGCQKLGKGEIGSSLAVVNDPSTRDKWAKEFGLSAFEQEGAALAAACSIKRRGYVMIRGISDFCADKTQAKDDVLQSLASHAAVACMGLMLSSIRPIEPAIGGISKPPLILHGFKRAISHTEEVQLRATKSVEIVSANPSMDADFEHYIKRTVSQRRQSIPDEEPPAIAEERVLDPEKIPLEKVLHHIRETWIQLTRPGLGDPQYKIHFGRTGNVGAVVVDGSLASLFVYTGRDNECVYTESDDPEFVSSVRQLFRYAREGLGGGAAAVSFPVERFADAFDEAAIREWLRSIYEGVRKGLTPGPSREQVQSLQPPSLRAASLRTTRERVRLLIENVGPTFVERCYGKLTLDADPGDLLPLAESGGLPMFSYGEDEAVVEGASTCWEKSPNPDEIGIPSKGMESLMLARLVSFHGRDHIEIPSEEGESQPPETDRNGGIVVSRKRARALLRNRGRPYTIIVEVGTATVAQVTIARVSVGIGQNRTGQPKLTAEIVS